MSFHIFSRLLTNNHTTAQIPITKAFAVLLSMLFLATCCLANPAAALPQKKLIYVGWDSPYTDMFRENISEMQDLPFDGFIIRSRGKTDDDRTIYLPYLFNADKWEREWFTNCIEDLKAAQSTRFQHNLLMTGANPGSVDWFDDEGWANVVEHFRIAAWIAKEGGLRGINFDPEPYVKDHAAFTYGMQPHADDYTFDQYWEKARERGRDVMQAVAEEFPDILFHTFFLNSINLIYAEHPNPRLALQGSTYGLLVPFFDGMLDVVPPTVTFVDGCESAYLFNSNETYLDWAVRIKGIGQNFMSPENRARYRAQVQVGYGMYLDAYANPPTSTWYVDGLGGPRVDRLRENTISALRAADEYVWVYGEKFKFFPVSTNPNVTESWEEGLPGVTDALAIARDPVGFGMAQLDRQREEGTLVNLARNGDFTLEQAEHFDGRMITWQEGNPPAAWISWQAAASEGTFSWDRQVGHTTPGSARAANVQQGCFLQTYIVEPGEMYGFIVRVRTEGNVSVNVRSRWQTPDGRWHNDFLDKLFFPEETDGEWQIIRGVAKVPDDSGRMVLLLNVSGQRSDEDIAWFDDVEVYTL